jgi:hypothetical protein
MTQTVPRPHLSTRAMPRTCRDFQYAPSLVERSNYESRTARMSNRGLWPSIKHSRSLVLLDGRWSRSDVLLRISSCSQCSDHHRRRHHRCRLMIRQCIRLLHAASEGDADTLRALLASQVDVHSRDRETGRTAMHLACRNGMHQVLRPLRPILTHLETGQFDIVKCLAIHGFNQIDATDCSGWTALSLATKYALVIMPYGGQPSSRSILDRSRTRLLTTAARRT